MFQFDKAALPQITTRKALIVVDFQNDFLESTGALPCKEPEGYVERALQLVSGFRGQGDIVWALSEFKQPRPVDAELILVSDKIPVNSTDQTSRGRSGISRQAGLAPDAPIDPEAFLSHAEPKCVRAASDGLKMPPVAAMAVRKGDTVLTRSHYSAFKDTQLLRQLRGKMVMEVYICGSLANVGVYATALDAATHGMSITVVEDCCGYREEQRQLNSVKSLIELTGCEISSLEEVLEALRPRQSRTDSTAATARTHSNTSNATGTSEGLIEVRTDANSTTISPEDDIVGSMAGLRLAPPPMHKAEAGKGGAATSRSKADSQNAQPKMSSKKHEAIGKEKKPKDLEDLAIKLSKSSLQSDNAINSAISNTGKTTYTTKVVPRSQPTSTTTTNTHNADMDTQPETADASTPNTEGARILNKGLCEGDTDIIVNVLPKHLAENAFDKLQEEVQWQRMSHQGGEVPRLVAVQGEVAADGAMPVYRHPSDESPPLLPFSPTVLAIKAETEKQLGHKLNHVLIQFYRDGKDYISEHSDKTIDVVKGSYIANVSLGAERTMVFRTKRLDKDPSQAPDTPDSNSASAGEGNKRKSQRAQLPHNSLCRMGLRTNEKWLHAIRQDKRAEREKTAAELAFEGGRISLTFRQIGTFLDREEKIIWGQGATGKTREDAKPVINGQSPEAVQMLRAFGTENHSSSFDWDAHYGKGFDVLHISNSPRLFVSADPVANIRVALTLAEYGINYAKGSMAPASPAVRKKTESECENAHEIQTPAEMRFVDNDAAKTVVNGELAIMLYLDAVYGQNMAKVIESSPIEITNQEKAQKFGYFTNILSVWRTEKAAAKRSTALQQEMKQWNDTLASQGDGKRFLAGSNASIADFAVWPTLHAIVERDGPDAVFSGLEPLRRYYERFGEREPVKKVLGRPTGNEEERSC